jgi:glycosidase
MAAVEDVRAEVSSAQIRRRRAAIEDGLAHGARIFPRDPQPGEAVTVTCAARATLPVDLVAVYFTTDGSEPLGERGKPLNGFVVEAEAGVSATDAATGLSVREWRASIPGQPDGTLVRYRIEGWSVRGERQSFYADRADPLSGRREGGRVFAYSVDTFQAPEWLDDAILYQVLVDRFSAAAGEPPLRDPGDNSGFYGGTLAGVLEQLDYIQAVGATALWLTPVLESPSHHGDDPASFYYVAKRFGTNETLRRLIREAHQREMKVILDFVANHTSTEHPLFQRAQADPESTLRSWYTFGDYPPQGYRTNALVEGVPELNTDNPDVQRYLTTAARFWLGDLGADGLRLDYVTGPSHAFWTIFQREIKRDFPQALTLGEVSESTSELAAYAGRLDAVMNIPLAARLREVFARRAAPLDELLRALDDPTRLPAELGRATLLDNPDLPRFLWLAGGNVARLRLAATCQMTLDGTPIIYYGTEVGATQTGDAEDAEMEHASARASMPWGEAQNRALLAHFRALCLLRRGHPALRYGRLARLPVEVVRGPAEAAPQVGAYLRSADTEYLVVVLNNTEAPVTLRVELASALATMRASAALPPELGHRLGRENTDALPVMAGAVTLDLPPLGAAVLGPQ